MFIFSLSIFLTLSYHILDLNNYFVFLYSNYYFSQLNILVFLLILLSSDMMLGTSKSGVFIEKILYILSKITWFLSIIYIPYLIFNNNYIFYTIPIYIPFFSDYAEIVGNYKLSYDSFFKKINIRILKDSYIIVDNPNLYITQPVIFSIHPHGLLPLGTIFNFSFNPKRISIFKKHFPIFLDNKLFVGSATFNYFIPIIREIYLLLGGVDCSRPVLDKLLKLGNCVAIFLGGAHESIYSGLGQNKLMVNNRWGIFKISIENGFDIIPIFTFQENNLFNAYLNNNYLNKIFHKFTGLWLPVGYFNFKKIKYITVIGRAISVEKNVNYTKKDLIDLKDKYKNELNYLFEKYKYLDPYLEANVKLEFKP